MPKKSDDANRNLIQVLEEARKIKVTPENKEKNSKYIDDNNGSLVVL